MNNVIKRENVRLTQPATPHPVKSALGGNLRMLCQAVAHSRGMAVVYSVLIGDYEIPDLAQGEAERIYGRVKSAAEGKA